MQKCYQCSFVIKNASVRLQKYTLNASGVKRTVVYAQHVWQQHSISGIKSTHMGHHSRKGRICAEFLRISCVNGIRMGYILELIQ